MFEKIKVEINGKEFIATQLPTGAMIKIAKAQPNMTDEFAMLDLGLEMVAKSLSVEHPEITEEWLESNTTMESLPEIFTKIINISKGKGEERTSSGE